MSITSDLATAEETDLLLELWQLYMQDLARFRNLIVENDGRYRDDRLRTYLAYEEHWPLVIRSNGEVAGFALVRKSKPDTHLIGEFFIRPEFRLAGIGAAAVEQILQKFSGNWEIPFQIENPIAASFWRKTIPKLGYEATESVSEFADDQKISSDCLLMFSI
ncbi:MAG: GNAT family N-acetyltransferase [Actinobacteria bacterium]|nr:GNAT family N-acetyltransferase [Actinomycetota bacterium]